MPGIIGNNDVCCITLAMGFLCLSLFSSFHLAKITLYGHNPFSFHVVFGVLTFLWTTIRALFFGLNLKISKSSRFLLYWLPSDLEWAVYLLILVFYVYWIQDEDALALTPSRNAKRIRLFVNIVYIALCLASFLKTIVLDAGCADSSTSWDTETHGSYSFLTFQYVCLCLFYSWILISIQMRRRKLRRTIWDRLPKHGTLSNTMVGRRYMLTFWVIFASRMVYNWFVQVNFWKIKISIDSYNRKSVDFTASFFLCLWEIVPTVMVLWCFRSIPPTNDSFCWCWQGENYDQDYEALGSKGYLRQSISYDSNQVLSPGKWCDSPPHLEKSLQTNWAGDEASRIPSRQDLIEGGETDENVNRRPEQIRSLTTPLTSSNKNLIRTQSDLIVNGQSCKEVGPEFDPDAALASSPLQTSRYTVGRRKKRVLKRKIVT